MFLIQQPKWQVTDEPDVFIEIATSKRYRFFTTYQRPQGRHTCGYSLRHFYRSKTTGERYFAQLADTNYDRHALGEPAIKHPDYYRTLNSRDQFECHPRSELGNWKHSTKCRHQWEAKIRRQEKQSKHASNTGW